MAEEKKYDVGIYGLWYGNNYGSMVTYYALSKIMEKLGKSYAMLRNPLGRKIDLSTLRRSHPLRFGFAHYNVTDLLPLSRMKEHNNTFDAFLLGSDQMWNWYLSKPYGQSYFLDFVDDDKLKIAYATSFGQEKYLGPAQDKVITQVNLKRMDAISVRDDFSKRICQQDFDVEAELVMDPVFLCDRVKYEDLIKESDFRIDEKFIFAYILDPNPQIGEVLLRVAKQTGLKIYVIFNEDDDMQKCKERLGVWDESICYQEQATLQEWLYMFQNCSYVLTDSFHGTCFSVIFEKPFVVMRNNGRGGQRFPYLLGTLGLMDYMVESPNQMLEKFNALGLEHQIDYVQVKKNLEPMVEQSMQWLKNALTLKKNRPVIKKPSKAGLSSIGWTLPPSLKDVDLDNCRIVSSLLKEYGIQDVVLSSGTRHMHLVKFFEENSFFHTYNVLDERSAGFYAIGLATRLQRPVAVCCTSGTAASNYLTSVSEAYYQHVPVVFITADRYPFYLNQKEAQMVPQPDIYQNVCLKSVTLPILKDEMNRMVARRMVCDALITMTKGVKGPVHINVPLQNIVKASPEVYQIEQSYPKIRYIDYRNDEADWEDVISKLKAARILILYGQCQPMPDSFIQKLDTFAEHFDCVIAKEHISNIQCRKSVSMCNMLKYRRLTHDKIMDLKPNIVITVNGGTVTIPRDMIKRYYINIEHWDINESGNVEDIFRKLRCVFGCDFSYFLDKINSMAKNEANGDYYYRTWKKYEILDEAVPAEYSQNYAVYRVIKAIPPHSLLHLANSNTIRFASSYDLDPSVSVYCNRGTNGIDGSMSSFMGQCAVSSELSFLMIGDLSFFYDMNAIWNKPMKGNIRIIMFNNNGAGLLRHHRSRAITHNHNGIAQGWVESLGFRYLSSHSKEEFDKALGEFVKADSDKPIFFEVFVP